MNKIPDNNSFSEKKIIDISLKLILVFIMVAWCAMIIMPFVTVLLWSIILAITLYPLFDKLTGLLKGKKAVSATIVSLIMLVVLLVPFVLIITSLVDEAKMLKEAFHNDTLRVPPPNPKVADWPLVGGRLYDGWKALNENLEATIMEHREELKVIFQKMIRALMGVTSNVLMFTASIIIAGILMAVTDKTEKPSLQLSTKLTGDKGAEFLSVIIQTIRNVAKGIIGVAFIQFAIMGITFLLAGVPFAGIWGLIVLMLALVQLPTFLVALPVVIYMYSVKDPLPATLWAVIIIVAGLSDNVLKPWLMGKGAPVPMLVIFLGSVGGFILSGFIGLFTGAIILSLGYKLGVMWLEASQEKDTASPKGN
jgi:predicted PurR-regulated permease PerM